MLKLPVLYTQPCSCVCLDTHSHLLSSVLCPSSLQCLISLCSPCWLSLARGEGTFEGSAVGQPHLALQDVPGHGCSCQCASPPTAASYTVFLLLAPAALPCSAVPKPAGLCSAGSLLTVLQPLSWFCFLCHSLMGASSIPTCLEILLCLWLSVIICMFGSSSTSWL